MNPMMPRSLLRLGLLALGVASACDDATAGKAEPAKPGATTKPDAAAKPDAATKPDATTKPGSPQANAGGSDSPPPPDDSCTLTVSGAVTGEDTGRGGRMAISTSHWFAPGDRAGATLFADRSGAIINCNGTRLRVSIDLSGTATDVPLSPKVYEVVVGKWDDPKIATVLGTFDGASLMGPTGKIEILEFDASHIAGKLALTGTLMGPVEGAVTVAGTFRFKCAGLSGCG